MKQQRLNDPTEKPRYNFLNREIKRKSKECKEAWLQNLCKEVEHANYSKIAKQVFLSIKTITGTKSTSIRSVKNKDGEVLKDDERIKDRWKENHEDLYNQPTQRILINNKPFENEPAILRSEVQSAIKRLKGNKATGDDGISAEAIKAAGEKGVDIIHNLCNQIWNSEVIPEDWGKAVIVPIFKKKDKMDLANYRDISLLQSSCQSFLHHHPNPYPEKDRGNLVRTPGRL